MFDFTITISFLLEKNNTFNSMAAETKSSAKSIVDKIVDAINKGVYIQVAIVDGKYKLSTVKLSPPAVKGKFVTKAAQNPNYIYLPSARLAGNNEAVWGFMQANNELKGYAEIFFASQINAGNYTSSEAKVWKYATVNAAGQFQLVDWAGSAVDLINASAQQAPAKAARKAPLIPWEILHAFVAEAKASGKKVPSSGKKSSSKSKKTTKAKKTLKQRLDEVVTEGKYLNVSKTTAAGVDVRKVNSLPKKKEFFQLSNVGELSHAFSETTEGAINFLMVTYGVNRDEAARRVTAMQASKVSSAPRAAMPATLMAGMPMPAPAPVPGSLPPVPGSLPPVPGSLPPVTGSLPPAFPPAAAPTVGGMLLPGAGRPASAKRAPVSTPVMIPSAGMMPPVSGGLPPLTT